MTCLFVWWVVATSRRSGSETFSVKILPNSSLPNLAGPSDFGGTLQGGGYEGQLFHPQVLSYSEVRKTKNIENNLPPRSRL